MRLQLGCNRERYARLVTAAQLEADRRAQAPLLKSFTERGKATNCDSVALIGSTKVMYLALSIRLSWRV